MGNGSPIRTLKNKNSFLLICFVLFFFLCKKHLHQWHKLFFFSIEHYLKKKKERKMSSSATVFRGMQASPNEPQFRVYHGKFQVGLHGKWMEARLSDYRDVLPRAFYEGFKKLLI
jgi:hypothetical protein